jgi:hypothetical protein
MMGLCAFLGGGLGFPGACETSLTGFQAELTLQDLDDFFHLMPFPVQCAHFLGGSGQPVGGVVFAAVSHHKDFEPPGE